MPRNAAARLQARAIQRVEGRAMAKKRIFPYVTYRARPGKGRWRHGAVRIPKWATAGGVLPQATLLGLLPVDAESYDEIETWSKAEAVACFREYPGQWRKV